MRTWIAALALATVIGCGGGGASGPDESAAAAPPPVLTYREANMDLEVIDQAVLADLNGDGRDDLVAVSSSRILIYASQEDGTFDSEVLFGMIRLSGVSRVRTGDFDRNGCRDLLVEANGSIYRILSYSNQPGAAEAIGSGIGICIDGDDCLAMDPLTGAMIRFAIPGAPAMAPSGDAMGLTCRQEIVDVDDNGLADVARLVAPEWDPTSAMLELYVDAGDGTYVLSSGMPMSEPYELVAGDFENNGRRGLLAVHKELLSRSLALKDGLMVEHPLDFHVRAIADIDGDGRNDLIGWSDARIETSGTATAIETLTVDQAYFLTTGDLNGDGRLDLMIFDHRTLYQGMEPYFLRE